MVNSPCTFLVRQCPISWRETTKKNAPNVIKIFLSLHRVATTVPNINGKLLLVHLIASGESWAEGLAMVLRANPAALLYENMGLSGFPYMISRVAAE